MEATRKLSQTVIQGQALPRRRSDESAGEFAYRVLADQSLAEIGELR